MTDMNVSKDAVVISTCIIRTANTMTTFGENNCLLFAHDDELHHVGIAAVLVSLPYWAGPALI